MMLSATIPKYKKSKSKNSNDENDDAVDAGSPVALSNFLGIKIE